MSAAMSTAHTHPDEVARLVKQHSRLVAAVIRRELANHGVDLPIEDDWS